VIAVTPNTAAVVISAAAPAAIGGTKEFSRLCPSSAIRMLRAMETARES